MPASRAHQQPPRCPDDERGAEHLGQDEHPLRLLREVPQAPMLPSVWNSSTVSLAFSTSCRASWASSAPPARVRARSDIDAATASPPVIHDTSCSSPSLACPSEPQRCQRLSMPRRSSAARFLTASSAPELLSCCRIGLVVSRAAGSSLHRASVAVCLTSALESSTAVRPRPAPIPGGHPQGAQGRRPHLSAGSSRGPRVS